MLIACLVIIILILLGIWATLERVHHELYWSRRAQIDTMRVLKGEKIDTFAS